MFRFHTYVILEKVTNAGWCLLLFYLLIFLDAECGGRSSDPPLSACCGGMDLALSFLVPRMFSGHRSEQLCSGRHNEVLLKCADLL
jgi:hypothetical protein